MRLIELRVKISETPLVSSRKECKLKAFETRLVWLCCAWLLYALKAGLRPRDRLLIDCWSVVGALLMPVIMS